MTRELESKKDLVDEKATRYDENRNGNPHTLTLSANARRVTRLVPRLFPLLLTKVNSTGGREQLNSNHSTHFTHLTHFTHFKKAAFTLAEILITLGLIGIVAAMTIPNLISNYQAKELETRFKKAHSLIAQVCQRMLYDDGYIIQNPSGTSTVGVKFAQELQKYLYKSVECDNRFSCGDFKTTDTAALAKYLEALYKTYNKKTTAHSFLFDDGLFVTADGMIGFIDISDAYPDFYISIDINGFKKGPNAWGHDLFTFRFNTSKGIIDTPQQAGANICDLTSTSKYNGLGCTERALKESDYFKNLP